MITLTKTLRLNLEGNTCQYLTCLGNELKIYRSGDIYSIWQTDTRAEEDLYCIQGKSSDILLWIENRYAEFFAEEFPEVTLNFIWE
jgi:hypothetical protein